MLYIGAYLLLSCLCTYLFCKCARFGLADNQPKHPNPDINQEYKSYFCAHTLPLTSNDKPSVSIANPFRFTVLEQDLHLSTVAFNEICREALVEAKSLAVEKGINLFLNVPEEPVFLLADRPKLSQMINQILTYAVAIKKPGGDIELTVQKRFGRHIVFVVHFFDRAAFNGNAHPIDMLQDSNPRNQPSVLLRFSLTAL
jgi:hypothetical protein